MDGFGRRQGKSWPAIALGSVASRRQINIANPAYKIGTPPLLLHDSESETT